MADISFAVHTYGYSFSALSTYPTASKTYASTKAYLAVILNESSGAATRNHPTIPGWTEVGFRAHTAGRNAFSLCHLWYIGDGNAHAFNIDYAGQNQAGIQWRILEISASALITPVVQYAVGSYSSGVPTAALAAFGDAVNNVTLMSCAEYGFTTIGTASGYSLISNTTADLVYTTQYKKGEDRNPALASFGDEWVLLALEIAIPAVAGGVGARAVVGQAVQRAASW